MDTYKQMGWVKIAWTYAFQYLSSEKFTYADAIKDIIGRGGDTDTNAAIVGGLLGAAFSVEGIPDFMISRLISCSFDKGKA